MSQVGTSHVKLWLVMSSQDWLSPVKIGQPNLDQVKESQDRLSWDWLRQTGQVKSEKVFRPNVFLDLKFYWSKKNWIKNFWTQHFFELKIM